MTKSEVVAYRDGYHESRHIILNELRDIIADDISDEGKVIRVQILIAELVIDVENDHWRAIQEESPGITEEEYEASLDAAADEIRKTFYSEKGILKPRLVQRENE